MAVKTITIDMEAYRILDADKRVGESFSRVIKRRIGGACTGITLLHHLPEIALSEDALAHIEGEVASRKTSLAEFPTLD